MGSKSWLAIDVGTAPMLRAQELRFAWERFVSDLGHDGLEQDGDPDDIREPIVESWWRSLAAGIDPTAHELAPVLADEDETQMLWSEHPLGRARQPVGGVRWLSPGGGEGASSRGVRRRAAGCGRDGARHSIRARLP